jgi:hypothetical protein
MTAENKQEKTPPATTRPPAYQEPKTTPLVIPRTVGHQAALTQLKELQERYTTETGFVFKRR